MTESVELSEGGQRVYLAMLERPEAGVAELAVATGLDEGEVKDQLEALANLRLLEPDHGTGQHLRPPHLGYGQLIDEAEREVLRRQAELAAARTALTTLAAEHLNRHQRDAIVHLTSLEAINDRLGAVAEAATVECLSFNPGHRTPESIEASKPLNASALERGVAIRFVYAESVRNDRASLDYGNWLADHGGEARTVPIVPYLMVIVDRLVALIPSNPSDPRHGALEVRSPGVIAALLSHFEDVWSHAQVLGAAASVDEVGLTEAQRELLRLSAVGHTDESAARRLGVSLRTVRRMMSELTERLGARSRFEAGVLAARRGWLD